MLPRPVVIGIVVLLTIAEAINIFGEVFLNHGASEFHFVYPTVLAALGFTSKGKVDLPPQARHHLRQLLEDPEDVDADTGAIEPPRHHHHRNPRKGDSDD